MRFPVRAVAGLLGAFLTWPALATSLRMEASTTWADNISRSAAAADQTDAWRHDLQLSGSHLLPLATGVSLIGGASLGAELMPGYSRNSAWLAGASAELRKKFGLGALAPVLAVNVGLQRREARIPGDHAWIASGSLQLSKRLTDAWRVAVTGDWEQNYAAHSTFDVRHHRLFATVSWDVTERWQFSGGRGSLWGDFDASASWNSWSRALAGLISPAVGRYYPTVSWEVTDAYGSRWVTYRVTGRSDFWWLQLSPAIGANTSLLLRYDSSHTENLVKIAYQQFSWTLGLSHRF